MIFRPPLTFGRLVRRYQRFLADVELADGTLVTAHCTNTGSLKTCYAPGWTVGLSPATNPERRLRYTWEVSHNGVCWIGVNTLRANRLAEEAIRQDWIPELAGYAEVLREKAYGRNSRIDLLLRGPRRPLVPTATPPPPAPDAAPSDRACAGAPVPDCYVEVKNVTLLGEDGSIAFPDAVTERGRKHLRELEAMVRQGARAVMLYVVQRGDGNFFRPAWEIDPEYARALRRATRHGVEILAYRAEVTPDRIELRQPLPIRLH